jgi:hypothetical protein
MLWGTRSRWLTSMSWTVEGTEVVWAPWDSSADWGVENRSHEYHALHNSASSHSRKKNNTSQVKETFDLSDWRKLIRSQTLQNYEQSPTGCVQCSPTHPNLGFLTLVLGPQYNLLWRSGLWVVLQDYIEFYSVTIQQTNTLVVFAIRGRRGGMGEGVG